MYFGQLHDFVKLIVARSDCKKKNNPIKKKWFFLKITYSNILYFWIFRIYISLQIKGTFVHMLATVKWIQRLVYTGPPDIARKVKWKLTVRDELYSNIYLTDLITVVFLNNLFMSLFPIFILSLQKYTYMNIYWYSDPSK